MSDTTVFTIKIGQCHILHEGNVGAVQKVRHVKNVSSKSECTAMTFV